MIIACSNNVGHSIFRMALKLSRWRVYVRSGTDGKSSLKQPRSQAYLKKNGTSFEANV